tara:strand:- start:2721 stop:3386 length:666 start_codon:yes stop_codon:yes gene_type:complete
MKKREKNYIENMIFDFDGVIYDSVKIKNNAFKKIVKGYNLSIQKKFLKFHLNNLGVSRYKKFEFLKNRLIKSKNKDFINDNSMMYKKILSNDLKKVKLIPGANFFIKKYKKFNLFISSGTPENDLKKICKEKKIEIYFKKIMGSPKNKIQHISDLKKKFKINKKNTIFFGDSITDFNAAKKYNLAFIQVGNNMKNNMVQLKIKDFHDKKIKKYLNERILKK